VLAEQVPHVPRTEIRVFFHRAADRFVCRADGAALIYVIWSEAVVDAERGFDGMQFGEKTANLPCSLLSVEVVNIDGLHAPGFAVSRAAHRVRIG
jgi:hypothetical protein